MSQPRYLVTGATGFIGSHLVRRLLDDGGNVHATLRQGSPMTRLADVCDRIEWHAADLLDRASLARCVEKARPDIVFHLAAETRNGIVPTFEGARLTIENYLLATLNLFEVLAHSAHPPAKVIRTGTIAEYGAAPVPYREGDREKPTNPYGAAAVASTRYTGMLDGIMPFTVVTARLALVYGPGQSEQFFIPAAIMACLAGQPFTVRRPQDKRDLIYIDDVVEGLMHIAAATLPSASILNLASGRAARMDEVAQLITGETRCNPNLMAHSTESPNEDATHLQCSTELMRAMTGWSATTSLEEGLARTVASMRRSMAATA